MVQQEEQISRKKRKALLARLKERIQPKMGLVLFSAVLSWVQFLMRLISFFLIARGFAAYLEGKELDLVGLLAMLLGLNAFGFGVALFAKKLQGLASQFARDSLKQSFFEALMAQDGQFESQKTAADVFTIASQGIDSLDTYYSYYMLYGFGSAHLFQLCDGFGPGFFHLSKGRTNLYFGSAFDSSFNYCHAEAFQEDYESLLDVLYGCWQSVFGQS